MTEIEQGVCIQGDVRSELTRGAWEWAGWVGWMLVEAAMA